jgi:hypothetical protein
MVWSHTPRLPVLLWTAFTFPFTIWDTLYIALRPHTLPGHKWHDPIWTQVGTYAAVDGVYGEQAWLEGEGWTAAQGVVNVAEVLLYLWYYAIVRKSRSEGRAISGRMGGKACVIGLVAGTVTLTKSMLYCKLRCERLFGNCSLPQSFSNERSILGIQICWQSRFVCFVNYVGAHEVSSYGCIYPLS